MKRILNATLATIALVTIASPASALTDRFEQEFKEGLGNKLTGRFEQEFNEGLGNKLSGRFEQEFKESLGNR
ncbi:MAG: hypothetical protein AAGD25_26790 [Cyanobacteria bacterium P01_F01_bin.150]